MPAALISDTHTVLHMNAALTQSMGKGVAASEISVVPSGEGTARLSAGTRNTILEMRPLDGGGFLALEVDDAAGGDALALYKVDTLTGLPDRSVLDPLFRQLKASAHEADCALLLIDLDRFKNVNDTLGHPVGDALLIQVVERLQSATRDDDTLLRLGGDEFALIQTNAPQPQAANALAQRLIDLVGRTYLLDGSVINIGASIGISVQKVQDADATNLLKCADLALYHSKENGRGQHHFFEAAMEEAAINRREMEGELRRAIALRQFVIHYQPLADLEDRRITGVEALVRWRHPTKGLVAPDDFIPMAEETGLINQIGSFVLQKACITAAKWPSLQILAVNVSVVQIETEGFVDIVKAALKRSGLAPERLELEVTESLMLNNMEQALAVLEDLRALGVRIVMDDFGTGYSSLSYLQSFPFDKVKIDRSFISQLDQNEETANIIKAIVDLGVTLGMKTTAEGVETQDQLDQLKNRGCSEIQGYLISRPLTETDLTALLAADAPSDTTKDDTQ